MTRNKLDLFLLLRFIACILVVRQHVAFPIPNYKILNFPIGWLFGGTLGSGGFAIIVFFTLSGYLMGKNFFNGRYKFNLKGILKFYINRFKRIAPLYYFVTIFTIFFVFSYILDWVRDSKDHMYLITDLLFFNYYGQFQFNPVYWTLSIEIAFYIICPIIFFVLSILSKNKLIVILLLILNTVYSFYSPIVELVKVHKVFEFTSYFIYGSLVYLILKYFKFNITKHKYLVPISFIFCLLSMMFPWEFITNKGNISFMLVSIITTIFIYFYELYEIYTIEDQKEVSSTERNYIFTNFTNFINYLGLLSYGIYLIHIIILSRLGSTYGNHFALKYGPLKGGLILFLLTTIVSTIIAIYLHESVEIPGRKNINKIVNLLGNLFSKLRNRLS